jgi:hypothetical protein
MNPGIWKTVFMMAIAYSIINSATAQTIESLVMPGPVTESHAEVETECSSCHEPFSRGQQRTLCITCHEDVGLDIERGVGFHGLFAEARDGRCADCHTDHEGRDSVIVILDENTFDHDFTDYPLLGRHGEAACADCHEPEKKHREAPSDCVSCHLDDDVHDGFTGTECSDCHNETEWLDIEFDHDTTDYPLLGKHMEVACGDCHEDKTLRNTPTTCYGCHAEDDSHNGRSGQNCENCHNPSSWDDSSFDHSRDTEFRLDGGHASLSCGDCHSEDPFADTLEMACVSCHLEDDNHEQHFGDQCDTCHATDLWTSPFFDHDVDTEHALIGAHESIECTDCHIEPIFEVELLTACNDCHAEDDPHEGEQGIVCKDCHNESSWQDDVFFDHDLTRFPLLGSHAEVECESCHETHVFRDAPELCVDCHIEDDPHEGRFHEDCASCHNPVDWPEWMFDHDTETAFPLSGAHLEVLCDDCHRQPLASMSKLVGRCGDCHRADDIHDREFGTDCGRCHSADSFSNVEAIK